MPVRKQADGTSAKRYGSFDDQWYRAPSWSWASLDAAIRWDFPASCEYLLVSFEKDCVIEPEQPHENISLVTSARMYLHCVFFSTEVKILNSDEVGRPREDGSYDLVVRLKDAMISGNSDEPEQRLLEPTIHLDTPFISQTKHGGLPHASLYSMAKRQWNC